MEDDPPPPFTIDEQAYGEDAFQPTEPLTNVAEVRLRNHRILELTVMPIQFNTAQNLLRVQTEMELIVEFSPAAGPVADHSALASPVYDKVMVQGLFGLAEPPRAQTEPPLYMVLMDDQFEYNKKLLHFMDWKARKGNRVVSVKTSDIDSGGAPSSDEITDYLRGLPDGDYPVYLMIIGMHTAESGVASPYYDGDPSDLALACRDSSDWLPDLFAGRLPAKDNDELSVMLEKVLDQDRTPPTDDIYQKLVIAGQIQDNEDGSNNTADRLFCATADSIITYFEADPGGIDYDVTHAMVNPDRVGSDGRWNTQSWAILWRDASGDDQYIGSRVYDRFISDDEAQQRIKAAVDSGIALLQHRDHGYTKGWGDPPYNSSNVKQLANGKNRPLVLSNNCLSGSYHKDDSFVKAWLTHPNGGAYAFLGATKVTSSGPNDWLAQGIFMGIFEDWDDWHNASVDPDWTQDLPAPDFGGEGQAHRVGPMFDFGRMYLYQRFGNSGSSELHFRVYHIFGDPEAYVQLPELVDPEVEHPEAIPPATSTQVVVKTGHDGANVCLYGPNVDVHEVQTTVNGEAVFNITPSQKGTLHVTVTGYGVRPHESFIRIAPVVTVSVPNGGEQWRQGFTEEVTWTSSFDTAVDIELVKGNTVQEILAEGEDNDGTFDWDISTDIPGGDEYRIKVISVDDDTVIDESDDLFTIVENRAPEFTSDDVVEGDVDVKYVYEIEAKDPDDDPIEIDSSKLPDWLSLTDNEDGTAKLKGTPGPDCVGECEITLTVTDDIISEPVEHTFVIDVRGSDDDDDDDDNDADGDDSTGGSGDDSGCGCDSIGGSPSTVSIVGVVVDSLIGH
jgi:hypothetical protein